MATAGSLRGDDRGPRPDEDVRTGRRGPRSRLHGRAGPDHRLPRTERRREDDHAADAARPRRADERHRDDRWPPVPGDRRPDAVGRRGPRGDELPPGPTGPEPSEDGRHGGRHRPLAHRRRARHGRPDRGRQAQGRWLLARHAPAARAGDCAPRRPGRPHPRRAVERPRPTGHRVAARVPASPRRRRAARCSFRRTCWRRCPRPSTTSSSSRRASSGRKGPCRRSSARRSRRCGSAAQRSTGSSRSFARPASVPRQVAHDVVIVDAVGPEQLGPVLATNQVVVYELAQESQNLESIFLELTTSLGGTPQFRRRRPTAGRPTRRPPGPRRPTRRGRPHPRPAPPGPTARAATGR